MVKIYVTIKKEAVRPEATAGIAGSQIEVSQERRQANLAASGLVLDAGLDYAQIFNEPEDPVWREAWRITERLISAMADEVKENNANFLVVTVTTGLQVYPDRKREKMMRQLEVTDLFYTDERIQTLGKRENFQVLSLASPFQLYADQRHVFLHGFANTAPGRGRWNEDGHRLRRKSDRQTPLRGLGGARAVRLANPLRLRPGTTPLPAANRGI
jgi:hypothetical protein